MMKLLIIPVVIAVLTGGSAPFWWGYIFPGPATKDRTHQRDTDNNDKHGHQKDGPPFMIGKGACGTGYLKPTLSFANSPAPNGSWDWDCDGQVTPNVQVCETLTAAQCSPNTIATKSRGGFCSNLREKGCDPAVPKCGTSGYIYPCYIQADGVCHAGGYPTPATVSCR